MKYRAKLPTILVRRPPSAVFSTSKKFHYKVNPFKSAFENLRHPRSNEKQTSTSFSDEQKPIVPGKWWKKILHLT
jgi:hypothetical protein